MNLAPLFAGPGRSTRPVHLAATVSFLTAAGLVAWSAAIHLHLWQTGYRSIPTIGPLFLAQVIGGFAVALLILAVRRLWVAVIGAGFVLSTMVGFLLSVIYGLFNFKESWDAPFAQQAFAIEVAGVVVCLIAGALCLAGSARSSEPRTTPAEDS
jgi:hypothetical protein